MQEKKIKRLSFSFPDTMKEELEKEAKKRFRKLPSLVKMILNNHLKKKG